jgi:hypothetical protein
LPALGVPPPLPDPAIDPLSFWPAEFPPVESDPEREPPELGVAAPVAAWLSPLDVAAPELAVDPLFPDGCPEGAPELQPTAMSAEIRENTPEDEKRQIMKVG